jgi:Na+(H+)/acetate symporter ActP
MVSALYDFRIDGLGLDNGLATQDGFLVRLGFGLSLVLFVNGFDLTWLSSGYISKWVVRLGDREGSLDRYI